MVNYPSEFLLFGSHTKKYQGHNVCIPPPLPHHSKYYFSNQSVAKPASTNPLHEVARPLGPHLISDTYFMYIFII